MSDDGADLGVSAEKALKIVLGGEPQPSDDEQATPEMVRARMVAAAHRGDEPFDYGGAADIAGGLVLLYLDEHPDDVALEAIGADDDSLYGRVKRFSAGRLSDLDLTGFQWGWAVNAAHYALGAPPVPNPAIITVG